jgi:topoisomerase-4 subunit B
MAEEKNLSEYNEASIRSLDWKEHIRLRPGMYIGKLGDGSAPDDGIYVLIKEVIDNCIDEHTMGYGKQVELTIENKTVTIRDYGRGIPLGKLVDVVSKINTGAKYDSKAFQKSVGLNGVGTKAVNALSQYFKVTAYREGRERTAEFEKGELIKEHKEAKTDEPNGTLVNFIPDETVFRNFHYIYEYIDNQLWNYCYLNAGLAMHFNGKKYVSKNGLLDLLLRKTNPDELRYPIIHLKGDDIEISVSHNNDYGEDIFSFVNGQFTTQGGTHQQAFREGYVKVIRDFYKKDFEASDIRTSIVAAVSVRVQEPVFESQTKTKLGSQNVFEGGPSMKKFIKTDNAADQLKELIINGDKGDGVPNILSGDNFIVDGIRQKSITKVKLNEMMSMIIPLHGNDELKRNWARNKQLIDLSEIPQSLVKTIISRYEEVKPATKQQFMNYMIANRLVNLIEVLDEF